MKILAARYIVPISSGPVDDGAVAIDGKHIVGIGKKDEVLDRFGTAEVEDLGEAAIMPGLVNCHSHLEITSMRGALDHVEHDFRSWLTTLSDRRSELTDEDIEAAALHGAREGARGGVTCFGDIGRLGQAGLKALKDLGLRGTVFQETEFSPDNRTAEADFRSLTEKFETLYSEQTDLVKVGLSPHSPYTVGSSLFELIAQYSILNRVPLSIHAAESANETELLMHGTGFFAGLYEKYGFEWNSPHCTPVEYLERLGVLSTRPLLAHCVTVDETDIRRIAGYGVTVAHCPKSNAKFGHGYAPLEAMLDAGIQVGIGSDSVGSNNLCDLLEESRFAVLAARNRPGSERFVTAREVLELATLGGAAALGIDDKVGSLESGKEADMAVVSLSSVHQRPVNDIHAALVFASGAGDVVRTIVAGKEIYRRAD